MSLPVLINLLTVRGDFLRKAEASDRSNSSSSMRISAIFTSAIYPQPPDEPKRKATATPHDLMGIVA